MYQNISSGMTCFEFDFSILTSSFSTDIWSFRQGGTKRGGVSPSYLNIDDTEWHHVKLVVEGTNILINVDGVDKTSKTLNGTINRFYIVLDNTKHTLLNYKNFVIY